MTPVKVLLADDHLVVLEGLRAMLSTQPDLLVMGGVGTGREALSQVLLSPPDVVLMDLRMPDMGGVEATREIRRQCPGVQVLVLTTFESDLDIVHALNAGASGYLLKDAPHQELFDAVRAAARGEQRFTRRIQEKLDARSLEGTRDLPTPRELEVLTQVALGFSNKQVAAELGVGEATVKAHLLRVFEKLQVEDRTAAVVRALEKGWLRR